MSSKWKTRKSHIEITLVKSKDTNSADCDTYNKCICIYGPELGSLYCFSSNSDVGLVENAAENIQGVSIDKPQTWGESPFL